jgi:hypothetical protein
MQREKRASQFVEITITTTTHEEWSSLHHTWEHADNFNQSSLTFFNGLNLWEKVTDCPSPSSSFPTNFHAQWYRYFRRSGLPITTFFFFALFYHLSCLNCSYSYNFKQSSFAHLHLATLTGASDLPDLDCDRHEDGRRRDREVEEEEEEARRADKRGRCVVVVPSIPGWKICVNEHERCKKYPSTPLSEHAAVYVVYAQRVACSNVWNYMSDTWLRGLKETNN